MDKLKMISKFVSYFPLHVFTLDLIKLQGDQYKNKIKIPFVESLSMFAVFLS